MASVVVPTLCRANDVSSVITWVFFLTDFISHMVLFVEMDPRMFSRLPLALENFPSSFGSSLCLLSWVRIPSV